MEVANNGLRPALPIDENKEMEEMIELVVHSWDEDAEIRPSFATITCCLRNFLDKLPNVHHLTSN